MNIQLQLDVVGASRLDISATVIDFDGNGVRIQRSPRWGYSRQGN